MERSQGAEMPPSHTALRNPLDVGSVHVQTASDRFGVAGAKAVRARDLDSTGEWDAGAGEPVFTWPTFPDTTEDCPDSSIFKQVPSMQAYRNNLTALSQVHDLYMVAYQNRVFVYRPRTFPSQLLPRFPDVQLYTPQTLEGKRIGGYIEPRQPHMINHLKVGFLGEQEVLVTVHDDGDVNIYFVAKIEELVTQKTAGDQLPRQLSDALLSPGDEVAPYLSTNVGLSAWGIAIHPQSRIIAISTNKREVIVIALALKEAPASTQSETLQWDNAEEVVRRRDRNYLIVLQMASEASNIPDVAFVDNEQGEAEDVVAMDIAGNTWFASIWKTTQHVPRLPHPDYSEFVSEEFSQDPPRGWGVVCLPARSFMAVTHPDQLVGRPLDLDPVGRSDSGSRSSSYRTFSIDSSGVPGYPCRAREVLQSRAQSILEMDAQHLLDASGLLEPSASMLAGAAYAVDNSLDVDLDEDPSGFGHVSWSSLEDFLDNHGEGLISESVSNEDDDGNSDAVIHPTITLDDEFSNTMIEPTMNLDDEVPVEYADAVLDDLFGGLEDDLYPDDDDEHAHYDDWAGYEEASSMTGLDSDEVSATWMDLPMGSQSDHSDEHSDSAHPYEEEDEGLPSLMPLFLKNGEGVPMLFHLPTNIVAAHAAGPCLNTEQRDLLKSYESGPASACPAQTGPAVYFPRTRQIMDCDTYGKAVRLHRRDSIMRDVSGRGPVSKYLRNDERVTTAYSSQYHLLRLFEDSIDMTDLRNHEVQRELDLACPKVMPFGRFGEEGQGVHFRATSRLNLVAHVPELQLVVVGSPTGRVALITPTKLVTDLSSTKAGQPGVLQHGFRVEKVLPTDAEEEKHRCRPRPLHGIAIAPVQEGRVERASQEDEEQWRQQDEAGNEEGIAGHKKQRSGSGTTGYWSSSGTGLRGGARRYRLMLHYRDHSIFSYVLWRRAYAERVCIL